MKRTLLLALVALATLGTHAQQLPQQPASNLVSTKVATVSPKAADYSALACPSNSSFGYPYGAGITFNGYSTADADAWLNNGTRHPCVCYTAFKGNVKNITGMRVYGFCLNAARLQDNARLANPISFHIAFYEPDMETLVYEEDVTTTGKNTGFTGTYSTIYTFDFEFAEAVGLEEGWWSIQALHQDPTPTGGFCVFLHSGVDGQSIIHVTDMDLAFNSTAPASYCFTTDGSSIYGKAMEFVSLDSPTKDEGSKYATVSVTFKNVGSDAITDGKFYLYDNNKLVATEAYGTAPAQSLCTYTFNKTLDLSEGSHVVTVKNATKSISVIGDDNVSVTTDEHSLPGVTKEPGESYGKDNRYEHISQVIVGEQIDNVSGKGEGGQKKSYSNYRDQEARLAIDETLDLYVQASFSGDIYGAAWIDWDCNGEFSEAEKVGTWDASTCGSKDDDSLGEPLSIKVPEGMSPETGRKLLRIVFRQDTDPDPVGDYKYGETEDYTIVLMGSATASGLYYSDHYLDLTCPVGLTTKGNFEISNMGGRDLETTLTMGYFIPGSADYRSNTTRPADKGVKLAYCNEFNYNSIYVADDVSYACVYPAEAMQNLKGMKLSSVDVYIASASKESYIDIYTGGTLDAPGKRVRSESFEAVSGQWNTIELEDAYTITGDAVWIALRVAGGYKQKIEDQFQIGVDEGPGITYYGDRILYSGYWWSMYDVDASMNFNFCIRGNLTGKNRPASLTWLDIDGTYETASGETTLAPYTIDATNLAKGLYQGNLHIDSNDPGHASQQIPVWLNVGDVPEGISAAPMTAAELFQAGDELIVRSDRQVLSIAVIDFHGIVRRTSSTDAVSLRGLHGPLVVSVVFADGLRESTSLYLK